MKVAVLLAVLGLVASGEALKCYTCTGMEKIAGVDVAGVLSSLTGGLSCSDFEKSEKFEKECLTEKSSCLNVVDPNNDKNRVRGCAPVEKNECENEGNTCYCTGELCNGSERGWPSAVLLLAALAAALVGGR